MPELPEVETVKIALSSHFLKCKINKVEIDKKKLRFILPINSIKLLKGDILCKISRRGKYLLFYFKSRNVLLVHLGMTGVFKIMDKLKTEKHDHIFFRFGKRYLIYNDVRRFGFFKVYNTTNIFKCSHLINLGLEPFDKNFKKSQLILKMKNKSQNLKQFLMNQNNIAGLGNIYCSEILYDCKISPLRKVKDIDDFEVSKILKSTREILRNAIKSGGTSLKDYRSPSGEVGYFKNELKVYNQENKYCLSCKKKSKIKKIIIQGRSTFFCEVCQT